MQPDNNLFDIVQIRMQQCCAAHPEQPLLFTVDESTRREQCCSNNQNQSDINDVLWCEQLAAILFQQAKTTLF